MKLFGFYITRTDWESIYKEQKRVNSVLSQNMIENHITNNPPADLGMIYKGDKYYQDDAGNWRNEKGQYVSPREVMAEQLRIERDAKAPHWDDIKKASKI